VSSRKNLIVVFKRLVDELSGLLRGRAWAVKDRNDDDECNGVGSSELGRVPVLGDTSEDVSGSDGDCGAGGLIRIKLKLDFHCRSDGGDRVV
jgi:hypothetical protein